MANWRFADFDINKVSKEAKEAKEVTALGTERVKYFDGIGESVQSASNVQEAIQLSKLNFEVVKYPISFVTEVPTTIGTTIKNYHEFPKQYATVRSDTMEPLGIVGKNYEILQNLEAFDFLDGMVKDAKFETAGSYGLNGAKSFITMSTEPMKILGDDFKPYILFTNSFDGSGSVRVMFTPIRVFCSNCITRAIKNAENKISIRHSTSLQTRLKNAQTVLLENTNYLQALKEESEKMAVTTYTAQQFEALVKELNPITAEASPIQNARNELLIESLMAAYNQEDLKNFNNTVYKAVQAFADYESHMPAFRQTKTLGFKNISNVMAGMPMTNMVANRLMAA